MMVKNLLSSLNHIGKNGSCPNKPPVTKVGVGARHVLLPQFSLPGLAGLVVALAILPVVATAEPVNPAPVAANSKKATPSPVVATYQDTLREALTGSIQAQNRLGTMLITGHEIKRDPKVAAVWFSRTATRGSAEGQLNLGMLYLIGDGVKEDILKATTLIKAAAEKGNAKAQNLTGYFYEHGIGVKPNEKAAVDWYNRASASGSSEAKSNLTRLGLPVPPTKVAPPPAKKSPPPVSNPEQKLAKVEKAEKVENPVVSTQKAAAKATVMPKPVPAPSQPSPPGDIADKTPPAQHSQVDGNTAPNQKPVKDADLVRTAGWFYNAAHKGDIKSQIELGMMYQVGLGVKEDPTKAAYYFNMAAQEDNSEAQRLLARLYYWGSGVPKNLTQALKWYILADGQEGEHLQEEHKILLKTLKPEQIAWANSAVQKFRSDRVAKLRAIAKAQEKAKAEAMRIVEANKAEAIRLAELKKAEMIRQEAAKKAADIKLAEQRKLEAILLTKKIKAEAIRLAEAKKAEAIRFAAQKKAEIARITKEREEEKRRTLAAIEAKAEAYAEFMAKAEAEAMQRAAKKAAELQLLKEQRDAQARILAAEQKKIQDKLLADIEFKARKIAEEKAAELRRISEKKIAEAEKILAEQKKAQAKLRAEVEEQARRVAEKKAAEMRRLAEEQAARTEEILAALEAEADSNAQLLEKTLSDAERIEKENAADRLFLANEIAEQKHKLEQQISANKPIENSGDETKRLALAEAKLIAKLNQAKLSKDKKILDEIEAREEIASQEWKNAEQEADSWEAAELKRREKILAEIEAREIIAAAAWELDSKNYPEYPTVSGANKTVQPKADNRKRRSLILQQQPSTTLLPKVKQQNSRLTQTSIYPKPRLSFKPAARTTDRPRAKTRYLEAAIAKANSMSSSGEPALVLMRGQGKERRVRTGRYNNQVGDGFHNSQLSLLSQPEQNSKEEVKSSPPMIAKPPPPVPHALPLLHQPSFPAVSETDINRAEVVAKLGKTALKNSDFVAALAHYRVAYKLDPTNLDHLHNTASLTLATNEPVKALPLFRSAARLAALAGKGSDAALYNYQISQILAREPEWVDKKLIEAGVISQEKANVVGILSNLLEMAISHAEVGKLAQAINFGKQALGLAQKNLGNNHAVSIMAERQLGEILMQQGDIQGAKNLLNQAVKHATEALGQNHPETLTVYNLLANLYEQQMDIEETAKLLAVVQNGYTESFGANHPITLRNSLALARVYMNLGESKKGEALLRNTCIRYSQNFGYQHSDTGECVMQYAASAFAQGAFPLALANYKQAAEILGGSMASGSPALLESQVGLAKSYHKLGRIQEAKELIAAVIRIGEAKPEDNAKLLDEAHLTQARLLMNAGKSR
ncbi:MAG: SEL1-like repeat protein [Magnetococcales bacterium]|nr:SEL1-like repeat protein [Magnetococcales bacterium]